MGVKERSCATFVALVIGEIVTLRRLNQLARLVESVCAVSKVVNQYIMCHRHWHRQHHCFCDLQVHV